MNTLFNSPGWNFRPEDEQLFKLHLARKVGGFPMLRDVFAEKDLYGVDVPPPWEMFRDMDDDPPSTYYHTETNKERTITRKTVYVFTKLKAAASPANSKKGVRVSRRVGGGTWSGKSKPKKIVDSVTGDIIGHTKQLAFEHDGFDEQEVGHWIMHEYSLTAGWGSDFVLCKITRCTTHPAPPPIVEDYFDFEDIFFDEEEIAAILREPAPKEQKTNDESEKILEEQSDAAYAKELEEMLQEHGEDKGCSFAEDSWDRIPPHVEDKVCSFAEDSWNWRPTLPEPDFAGDSFDRIPHAEDKVCSFAENSRNWHPTLPVPDFAENSWNWHPILPVPDFAENSPNWRPTLPAPTVEEDILFDAEEFAASLLMEPETEKHKTSEESEKILEEQSADAAAYAKELEEMLQEHGEDEEEFAAAILSEPEAKKQKTTSDESDMILEQSDADNKLYAKELEEKLQEHGEDKGCSFAEDSWNWSPLGGDKECSFGEYGLDFAEEDIQKMMMNYQLMI